MIQKSLIDLVCRIFDIGFCILDFEFGALDFGFWILSFVSGTLDFGFWIWDLGFWILDFGFEIWDLGVLSFDCFCHFVSRRRNGAKPEAKRGHTHFVVI